MTPTNDPIDANNWIDRINTSDNYIKDMLSFYSEGWDARGINDKKDVEDRVKANIMLTFTYIDEILDHLSKIKIYANSAFLKVNTLYLQTVLIAVPIDDYLKDEFSKIYFIAHEIQKSSKSKNYSVIFNFTFDDGSLDETILSADGFHKSHALKGRQ